MNFKIGDEVIIKNEYICELVFPHFDIRKMSQFCGKKAKIVGMSGDRFF